MPPWSHLLVSVTSRVRSARRDQLRLLCLATDAPQQPWPALNRSTPRASPATQAGRDRPRPVRYPPTCRPHHTGGRVFWRTRADPAACSVRWSPCGACRSGRSARGRSLAPANRSAGVRGGRAAGIAATKTAVTGRPAGCCVRCGARVDGLADLMAVEARPRRCSPEGCPPVQGHQVCQGEGSSTALALSDSAVMT